MLLSTGRNCTLNIKQTFLNINNIKDALSLYMSTKVCLYHQFMPCTFMFPINSFSFYLYDKYHLSILTTLLVDQKKKEKKRSKTLIFCRNINDSICTQNKPLQIKFI